MTRHMHTIVALMVSSIPPRLAEHAAAQDNDKLNEANNPLTQKITLNLHDYYVPSLYGVPGHDANQLGRLPMTVSVVGGISTDSV